ncbi:MAG: hypothetical protein J7L23_04625 [Candidatus Diapherotrites archaeon]|nr:hypothetical protein [Candidatus Diapherotrites archaeon]
MEEPETRIRTSFIPIRMISGQREPVSLQVEVTNKSREPRGYSVSVKVPSRFGFDRACLMGEKRVRIGLINPGEAKNAVFTIYSKFNVPAGLYNLDIVVRSHAERFDKVLDQENMTATLRVEK